ncbi:MAG: hypothetical protein ABJA93_11385 [Sporichthyaceae bacterium]
MAHVSTLVLDSQSGIDLRAVVVPFSASYRPFAVGLGTLALFATVVTAVVGAARGRLAGSVRATRVWRAVHISAYIGWAVAMTHGFLAGTDSTYAPITVTYLIALLVVAVSVSCRLWSHQRARTGVLSRSRDAGTRHASPQKLVSSR